MADRVYLTTALNGRFLLRNVAMIAIVFATGLLGMVLAPPASISSLIWPPSGVALAGLILFGRNLWPGVLIGTFFISLLAGNAINGHLDGTIQAIQAGGIALGAALQAVVGAAIVSRVFGQPINFNSGRDVALFAIVSGPVICLIAASFAIVTLGLTGGMAPAQLLSGWFAWFAGDMAGMLIVLPIAAFASWREKPILWQGGPITPLTSSMTIGLIILMGATLAAWKITSEITFDRNQATFAGMVLDSEDALNHRLETYVQSLDGGAGLIDSQPSISRQDWLNYINVVGLEKLPGVNGIGFIEPVDSDNVDAFVEQGVADGLPQFAVHPETQNDSHYVIKYIEPLSENRAALGLDIGFEANRRRAAESARDTGEPRITQSITLVQDQEQTPGFLLLRPVYQRGADMEDVQGRRDALRGWVYAPFIASRFMQELTSNQGELFTIEVYDGDTLTPEHEVYVGAERMEAATFRIEKTLPIMGQTWSVAWKSTPKFEQSVGSYEPFVVLGAGIALTLCFGGLLHSYARNEAYIYRQVDVKTRNHKEALEALYESERRFGDLAGLSPAGIIRTDQYGFCVYANASWLEVSGLDATSTLGAGWVTAIHPDDRETFHSEWIEAINKQAEHRATFRFSHGDDSSRWVDMISRPEIGEGGTMHGYIAVAMDVTERVHMEADLKASRVQAEAAVEAKSSFLANMSHEIRTPMNGVIGFTEMLLQSSLSEEQRRHTQLIADSGKSMMRLLNDILDLSKVEAGQMKVTCEPTNLGHIVKSSVTLMKALANDKGLDLYCEIDASVPRLVGSDGLRIRQILLNLLGNALKFTSAGSVTARARFDAKDGGQLTIEVEDTGIGIAQNRQEAIFNEFVQADEKSSGATGGTGLGLAICRKLAALMGGSVALESTLGKGSVFRLTLPAAQIADNAVTDQTVRENPANRRRSARMPRCGRILLVEDHDINQILMKDMLHQMGLDVEIASNGKVALECVKRATTLNRPFDLVLMDMRMPVMSGLDATRALRAQGHDPATLPIVALTANAFAEDISACIDAGMQAHVSKPVSADELDEAISRWCRKSSNRVSPAQVGTKIVPGPSGLKERYDKRKQDTLERVATLIRSNDFAQANLQEVAEHLHKLAGTAGLFGDAELGEHARKLECGLKTWTSEEIATNLDDVFDAMKAAA